MTLRLSGMASNETDNARYVKHLSMCPVPTVDLPAELSLVVLWFDGSDPTSMFTDEAGTQTVSPGSTIKRWNSKANRSAVHAYPWFFSNQYYTPNARNGRSAVRAGTPNVQVGMIMFFSVPRPLANCTAFSLFMVLSIPCVRSGRRLDGDPMAQYLPTLLDQGTGRQLGVQWRRPGTPVDDLRMHGIQRDQPCGDHPLPVRLWVLSMARCLTPRDRPAHHRWESVLWPDACLHQRGWGGANRPDPIRDGESEWSLQ